MLFLDGHFVCGFLDLFSFFFFFLVTHSLPPTTTTTTRSSDGRPSSLCRFLAASTPNFVSTVIKLNFLHSGTSFVLGGWENSPLQRMGEVELFSQCCSLLIKISYVYTFMFTLGKDPLSPLQSFFLGDKVTEAVALVPKNAGVVDDVVPEKGFPGPCLRRSRTGAEFNLFRGEFRRAHFYKQLMTRDFPPSGRADEKPVLTNQQQLPPDEATFPFVLFRT